LVPVTDFLSHVPVHSFRVDFEIVGDIRDIERIAAGPSIRDRARLKRAYGGRRWRKLKGIAQVRLRSGRVRLAELHWYEGHGVGKKEIRRKRYLD
jgi:hypothetical protein